MQHKKLKIALIICSVLLAAELIFLGVMFYRDKQDTPQAQNPTDTAPTTETTLPPETETTEAPTEPSSQATEPSQETDPVETEPAETDPVETEPVETKPEEQRYILTFVGDCTLASSPDKYNNPSGFIKTIGEDYDYPFRNVTRFFAGDDFTLVNLESVLADEGRAAGGKTFTFKGPTAYTQILTGSSVEAVTLANNHTGDYGEDGYTSTTTALDEAGVSYAEKDSSLLFTTESGLTIGIYAATFVIDTEDMEDEIADLRSRGAEIIVCAFHWGNEGQYQPTAEQKKNAYAAIDAGADIVYGSHPHVLQPIEEYNGGVIYYSLGNFCFGGNHFPRDVDSVIVKQEVIRREDGTLELGQLVLIPVSITSMAGQNNFQPTPYEEGTEEYDRTLSKLDGTYTGPNLNVDYSFLDPTEPSETTEPTEPATEPSAPATEPTAEPSQGSDGTGET